MVTDVGENTSSLWYESRYPGDMTWMGNSSDSGRGGRCGGGPRDSGGLEYESALESRMSSVLLDNGHCGDSEGAFCCCCGWRRFCENCDTSWLGLWGSPIIFDLSGSCCCICAACSLSRAARTEPFLDPSSFWFASRLASRGS